jgi:hypothetical protein
METDGNKKYARMGKETGTASKTEEGELLSEAADKATRYQVQRCARMLVDGVQQIHSIWFDLAEPEISHLCAIGIRITRRDESCGRANTAEQTG